MGKFRKNFEQATGGGGGAPSAHASTHVTGGSDVIASAVAGGNAGLMIGSDKSKLDALSSSGFVVGGICQVQRIADFSTGAGFNTVPFDSEVTDPDSLHDLATNPERITISQAGLYSVHFNVVFASSATGTRTCAINLNGVRIADGIQVLTANDQFGRTFAWIPGVSCAAGDYLTFDSWQNAGTLVVGAQGSARANPTATVVRIR